MSIHNYQKASYVEVQDWLMKSIPELSPYQKQKIRDDEIARFAPFVFFKRRKKVKSIWWRLTAILMPVVWLLLFISLPFNFILTGSWGYEHQTMKWFYNWKHAIGL